MICNHIGTMNRCHCSKKEAGGAYFICKECSYTDCVLPDEYAIMIDKLQDRRLMCPSCGSMRIYFEEFSSAVESLLTAKIKIGRNDPCPCGSNKKYKKCCLKV